jgi:hypothetical protein
MNTSLGTLLGQLRKLTIVSPLCNSLLRAILHSCECREILKGRSLSLPSPVLRILTKNMISVGGNGSVVPMYEHPSDEGTMYQ